jgi:tellurite resistance protein TerC
MIFAYFSVPPAYQHRVLFWGIIGAVVMRMVFIFVGLTLLEHFEWLIYVFGAFLIFTGLKLLVHEPKVNPEKNLVLRLARRFLRVTPEFRGASFVVKEEGRLFATPLLLVLVVVEATDVVFAVDSVPAILAIAPDAFIAYTSNIFAILGLRAMYFVLAGMMDKFHYLKFGLSLVLVFIGAKMLLHHWELDIPPWVSLPVVLSLLGGAVLLSLLFPPKARPLPEGEPAGGDRPEGASERGGEGVKSSQAIDSWRNGA